MRAPKTLLLLVVLAALLSVPGIAAAQETPTPGVTPEEVRGWTFYLFALPIALATVGVVAMIGVLYFRYSTRFFGREEPPAPVRRRRPQFAGVAPRVEQVGAASTTPPAAPAAEVRTAAEQVPQSRPAETAAAPAPAKEEPAPAKEERAPAKPEPAPSRPAAEHVEPDQATYERELKAQLDKGVDRRVAEGRAKAAAVRAARAGASSAPAPETAAPAVEKAEAETATEAGKDEAPAAKEPEVPPPTAPQAEAEQAEEAPTKVKAPRPEPSAPAATEGPPAKVPPGADEETFTRILQEQLAKGLARPIAESRARAAAVKAAREKADAG
jgi:hypothetical protein